MIPKRKNNQEDTSQRAIMEDQSLAIQTCEGGMCTMIWTRFKKSLIQLSSGSNIRKHPCHVRLIYFILREEFPFLR